MKNLHYLKKFVVMVLAAMMTLSTFAMPTFAADDTTAKIFGLPKTGVTVKAYKIVKQDNNGNWVSINNDGTWGGENKTPALTDPTKPTSAQITDLATKTLTEARVAFTENSAWTEGTTEAQKATQFWSADLKDDAGKKYGTDNDDGAGMYLVIVESTGSGLVKVYNPMIVSIYPDGTSGELKAGSVDANGNFQGGSDANVAYAKSSEPTFDKYITRDATENGTNDKLNHNQGNQDLTGTTNVLNDKTSGETEKGDTASRGDTVWFEINTTMPVYADNYTNPTFQIHDQLSSGLTLNQNSLEVWVDGKKVEKGDNTWSVAFGKKDDGDKFDITFTSAYLKASQGVLPQKKVVVKYSAVVDEDCDENFDPETNEAYITYTHKPGENKDSEKKKTYHYTFSINGRINGEGSTFLREVVKVGVTDEEVWVYEETKKADYGWKEDIEGATFNLYKDNNGKPASDVYRTAYSAADGRLVGGKYDANGDGKDETYSGLDRLDAGTYWLVEQSVPSPYKVKQTPIKVVITSNLNADGTLDWYKIEVGENPTVVAGEYKAIYDKNADGSYKLDKEGEPLIKEYQIKNNGEWKTSKTAGQAIDTTTGTAPAKPDKAAYDAAEDGMVEGKTYEEALNAWFAACKDYFAANDPLGEAADIPNTKTGTLPSTGGMGTVLFTIGGALIMALALFILFGGKKKQQQK